MRTGARQADPLKTVNRDTNSMGHTLAVLKAKESLEDVKRWSEMHE